MTLHMQSLKAPPDSDDFSSHSQTSGWHVVLPAKGVSILLCKRPGFVFGDGVQGKEVPPLLIHVEASRAFIVPLSARPTILHSPPFERSGQRLSVSRPDTCRFDRALQKHHAEQFGLFRWILCAILCYRNL